MLPIDKYAEFKQALIIKPVVLQTGLEGWINGDQVFSREHWLNNMSSVMLTIGALLLFPKEESLGGEVPAAWLLFFGAALNLVNKGAKIIYERNKQNLLQAQIKSLRSEGKKVGIEISDADAKNAHLESAPSAEKMLFIITVFTVALMTFAASAAVKVAQKDITWILHELHLLRVSKGQNYRVAAQTTSVT